jgi:hypothetical protein
MSEENITPATPAAAVPAKDRNPYTVFLWGGLVMAALCFYLGTTRLAIKRPARADAYFITGILGLLSAAMAFSLGKAHTRSLRSQQTLKDSVDRLQDRMHDMPRSLMEESVRVAEREAAGRRADQERQARELREALEGGITAGFKPLAPALSERIEASLSGLTGALRDDREERAKGLREMADALASLRSAQQEWAASSASLLEKLREQGALLHKEIGERDASGRSALAEVSAAAAEKFQAAADIQLEKARDLTEKLAAAWDASAQKFAAQTERAAAETSEALLKGLASAGDAVKSLGAEAETRLRASADQAAQWLESLSGAAGKIEAALQGLRQGGEDSAAAQAEWRATVDMFHQGLGGVLDRLQSLATYSQGQEALLHKMEAAIRAFEERSAELLEETALKAQESLLEALDKAGARPEGSQA